MFPELREIKEVDKQGIYWQVKLPFPLANRDVSFNINFSDLYFGMNRL